MTLPRIEGPGIAGLPKGPHGFIPVDDYGRVRGLEGVYAAGDVRAGSTKRCATAVGEGAAVVGFVHERLARVPA